jgi:hypothetical protein
MRLSEEHSVCFQIHAYKLDSLGKAFNQLLCNHLGFNQCFLFRKIVGNPGRHFGVDALGLLDEMFGIIQERLKRTIAFRIRFEHA